jgi:hypothetical protein
MMECVRALDIAALVFMVRDALGRRRLPKRIDRTARTGRSRELCCFKPRLFICLPV